MGKALRLMFVLLVLVGSSFVLVPMAGACNPGTTSYPMPCG
jgi:hypothetical protein